MPKKTLLIGSNISDLGNGNYQLTNTQQVDFVDWYANPNNYIGYFICDGEVNTCSQPRYIGKVAKTTYAYVNIDQKILIAKKPRV